MGGAFSIKNDTLLKLIDFERDYATVAKLKL
jgi:hypothetical protein